MGAEWDNLQASAEQAEAICEPPSTIMTTAGDTAQAINVTLVAVEGSNKSTSAASKTIDEQARRVTVWNRVTKRKVSGNAAPMEKNLSDYLKKHPECELYNGQDKHLTAEERAQLIAEQNRIPIWNKVEGRKISGNAAPSHKNLQNYLASHPNCEVYEGQDKGPGYKGKDAEGSARVPIPIGGRSAGSKSGKTKREQQHSFSEMFEDEGSMFSMSGLADSLPQEDCCFMGMQMSGPDEALSGSWRAAARNSFDDQRFDGYGISPDAILPPVDKRKMGVAIDPGVSPGNEPLGMSFSLQDEDLMVLDEEMISAGCGGIASDL